MYHGMMNVKKVKVFHSIVAIGTVGVRGPLYLGHTYI